MIGGAAEGDPMRKIALLLAVLMAASGPAIAAAKKKAKPAAQPAAINTNEASARFVRDALPLFLPTAVQVVYFSTQSDAAKKK